MIETTFESHIGMEEFPTYLRDEFITSLNRRMAGCLDIIDEWEHNENTRIRYKCNDEEVFEELLRQQDLSLAIYKIQKTPTN